MGSGAEVQLSLLDTLNKLGPFIGGVSLLVGASAAWATFFLFNRRTVEMNAHAMQMNWLDGFRKLYAEFWKEADMATVRSWIASDPVYQKVEVILRKRLQEKSCVLDAGEYEIIEKLDKFCSLLIRLENFHKTGMTAEQRNLWQGTYGRVWIKKIKERRVMAQYIHEYWPPLRDNF